MITNKVEYLILTLLDLARHSDEGYVVTREVAERQGIPGKYMPQMMSILAKKGWVDSARGPRGGVRLAADLAAVTIQDVIDLADDPLLIKQCTEEEFQCPKKAYCPLQRVWRQAQGDVDNIMKGTTLADLLVEHAPRH